MTPFTYLNINVTHETYTYISTNLHSILLGRSLLPANISLLNMLRNVSAVEKILFGVLFSNKYMTENLNALLWGI